MHAGILPQSVGIPLLSFAAVGRDPAPGEAAQGWAGVAKFVFPHAVGRRI